MSRDNLNANGITISTDQTGYFSHTFAYNNILCSNRAQCTHIPFLLLEYFNYDPTYKPYVHITCSHGKMVKVTMTYQVIKTQKCIILFKEFPGKTGYPDTNNDTNRPQNKKPYLCNSNPFILCA